MNFYLKWLNIGYPRMKNQIEIDRFQEPEPENYMYEITPEPESARLEICRYPTQTPPVAILGLEHWWASGSSGGLAWLRLN